jgi:hypothetical protein
LALASADRSHIESCHACATRLTHINGDHASVAQLFSTAVPMADLAAARDRIHAVARPRRRTMRVNLPLFNSRTLSRWAGGGLFALAVAGTVAFTPAAKVFTIFQPSKLAPVSISLGELRGLPNLRHFGSLTLPRNGQPHQYSGLAAAQQAAGFHVGVPSVVPSGTPSTRTFEVLPAESSAFTFDASKAEAIARRHHRTIPAMPADVNGSTISLQTSPAIVTLYGGSQTIPSLVIGQTMAPKVLSNGANLKTIEDYISILPGVPKDLARQIRSIGNPTSTLPIPVPVNWAYAQHVMVQGRSGLLVGDNTGVFSVVIWEENGVVYGVGGALTSGQVLHVANSLH